MEKKYILNAAQIDFKIRRMALEILERNQECAHLILAGIAPHGLVLAARLLETLSTAFGGKIDVISVKMDKKNPVHIELDQDPGMEGATVVLIDDVANSGKTLTYALKPFLNGMPAKIQTCVLVERTHKKFPVQADYVGHSLATTIQEYIEVEEGEGALTGAWMA